MTAPVDVGQLLRPLQKPLLAFFVRAIADRAEAEDLTQEVNLRVIRHGQLDDYDRFAGFVFRCADSVLKDRHRRRVVRNADRHVELDEEALVGSLVPVDRQIIARQTLSATEAVLEQLPERTRAVFVLRRLDLMPYGEIALRLGMSVSTAEKHMRRATRHLVARTGERG